MVHMLHVAAYAATKTRKQKLYLIPGAKKKDKKTAAKLRCPHCKNPLAGNVNRHIKENCDVVPNREQVLNGRKPLILRK